MASVHESPAPGYRWRSSTAFLMFTVTIGLTSEAFLYAYIVPILGYMIEVRLGLDAARIQTWTTALLSIHGLISVVSAPIIAHFADKTPKKQISLLFAVSGGLVGTILVAFGSSIETLFAGRLIQGIAGSATWIVGFAALSDNVDKQNLGKAMGWAMTFVAGGALGGPAISGALLELQGYWQTWSVPLAMLAVDLLACILMIEKEHEPMTVVSDSVKPSPLNDVDTTPEPDETTGLLGSSREEDEADADGSKMDGPSSPPRGFYRIVLGDVRILTGLLINLVCSAIIASFDTTLPSHLRSVFGWNSLHVGVSLLALQTPSLVINPFVGWLRDRVGLRYPTSVGWCLLAPLLWLLGTVGHQGFEWASPHTNGVAISITTLICIGITSAFVRGADSIQLPVVLDELQTQSPESFGQYGGTSRIFSMLEVAFSVGLMIGPLISGLLTETLGYYFMNCTLMVVSLSLALISFLYIIPKQPTTQRDTQA
ncbi:major facilitator superfamily domain-containing protein [Penicillium hispanicum]|uniref:major facilitator superfamily domain-containing protein n=1 Tax=Penicillium hispanicum TaxID=1080232 RepID=UPI002540182E|nr:major facilitator superfamily domain-containing protein [Penicillium hispanicum]KAJ5570096.1 major facilitator superfamily domain-containing protein [Penicillium hispanicum]